MHRVPSRETMSRSVQRNKNNASTASYSTGRESSGNKNETIFIDLTTFYSQNSPQSPLGKLNWNMAKVALSVMDHSFRNTSLRFRFFTSHYFNWQSEQ